MMAYTQTLDFHAMVHLTHGFTLPVGGRRQGGWAGCCIPSNAPLGCQACGQQTC